MRQFVHTPSDFHQVASSQAAPADRRTAGSGRSVDSILNLQRNVGNQAVQHVLSAVDPGTKGADLVPELSDRIQAKRGSGRPLTSVERDFMEPRFGVDFSAVRIHTDKEADAFNCVLDARAFTLGHDIFLRGGSCDSSEAGGRRLLAHELTHVVQQTRSPLSSGISGASADAEREAASAAAIVARGDRAPTLSSCLPALACEKVSDAPAIPMPTEHLADDPELPEHDLLAAAWGDGEFGGDPLVSSFVDALLQVLAARAERGGLPNKKQHLSRRKALTRSALIEEFSILIEYQQAHAKSYGPKGLKYGWMRGLLSRLDFATRDQGPEIHKTDSGWTFNTGNEFAPIEDRVEIPAELAKKEGKPREWPKVAPIMASLLTKLEVLASAASPPILFRADNRDWNPVKGSPHASGYAADVYLEQITTRVHRGKESKKIGELAADDENFWNAQTAIRFLLLIDLAASAVDADWHVIYNDFRVAQAVNSHLGYERVTSKGLFQYNKKGKPDMEWHGPSPLVLHFHLDAMPKKR